MTKTIEKIEELIKEGIIISEKAVNLIGNHPQQKIDEQKAEQRVSKMTKDEIDIELSKIINKPNKKIDKMTDEEAYKYLFEMLGDKPFKNSVRNLMMKYIHWHNNIKKTMPNKIETASLFMPDNVYTVDDGHNSGEVILETIKKETDKKIEKLEELGKNLNDGKLKEEKIINKLKFKDGILAIDNKEIDFNRKPNQKGLLITLFKKSNCNWSYDEIYDDWGESDFIEDGWRKLYTAGDGINKAIAVETNIKNFITKNTKQIQINQEYI